MCRHVPFSSTTCKTAPLVSSRMVQSLPPSRNRARFLQRRRYMCGHCKMTFSPLPCPLCCPSSCLSSRCCSWSPSRATLQQGNASGQLYVIVPVLAELEAFASSMTIVLASRSASCRVMESKVVHREGAKTRDAENVHHLRSPLQQLRQPEVLTEGSACLGQAMR